MTVKTATPTCPCGRSDAKGRPLDYAQCCGRWLEGGANAVPAPDAHSLMRSRYSAFVRGDHAYLLATWHPSQRPATLELDANARWLGLTVRSTQDTGPDQAEVEFIARYRGRDGRAQRLHERSRFVREQGRWYYLDGQQFDT